MTRAHTTGPVWTWHCDRCGRTSGDLAYGQRELPDYGAMRKRGWFIAEKFGDLCPRCNLSELTAEQFNAAFPLGTRVRFWPGAIRGAGTLSATRTPAWTMGGHTAVVSVEGHAGGIALTHIEVIA